MLLGFTGISSSVSNAISPLSLTSIEKFPKSDEVRNGRFRGPVVRRWTRMQQVHCSILRGSHIYILETGVSYIYILETGVSFALSVFTHV